MTIEDKNYIHHLEMYCLYLEDKVKNLQDEVYYGIMGEYISEEADGKTK
jgi:hypothetical protein